MATTSTPIQTDLVLVMDNGIGSSGRILTRARRYAGVKTAANNDDIYAVAEGLVGLQSKTLVAVQRQDTFELEQV